MIEGEGDSLEFGQLAVKVHYLDAHQLETLVHNRSAQLICRELETEKETWERLGRHGDGDKLRAIAESDLESKKLEAKQKRCSSVVVVVVGVRGWNEGGDKQQLSELPLSRILFFSGSVEAITGRP